MDEEYLNLFTSDHFVADVKRELTFPGLSRLSLGLGHEWVSIYIGGDEESITVHAVDTSIQISHHEKHSGATVSFYHNLLNILYLYILFLSRV